MRKLYTMALSNTIQGLLNKFAATQPALQLPGKPASTAGIKLGDVLDGLSQSATDKTVYDFTVLGGAVGAITLPLLLKAGTIVTRIWTDETVTLTSGGSATLALSSGATALVSAAAFTGFAGTTAHNPSAPTKIAADSYLTLTVAVAALTAGQLRVFVEYLK